MAAAAALRLAARRVCGRALERQQAYFTTAASAALREQQSRLPLLLPRIGRGGSSLRRFSSSSESPSVLSNNKQGAKLAATRVDEVLTHGSSTSPWSADNPKLRSNVMKAIAGAVIAGTAIYCLETMYIFRDQTSEMEEAPKKNAD